MHPGLQILEIVELICEQIGTAEVFLAPGSARARDQLRDLALLARTSKIFLDPALNVLWRSQRTLKNILNCMPSDLWETTVTTDEEGIPVTTINLRRTIFATDWRRPLFYLHRVRKFSMHPDDVHGISDVFEALTLCPPPGDLIFPNLETLHWSPEYGVPFHHVRLFLAASLTDLTLGSIRTIAHLCVLSNLATRCPFLKKIDIHVPTEFRRLSIPSISALICKLPRLESVDAPGLDERALAHISHLPDLTHLRLESFSGLHDLFPQLGADYLAFPALTELTMPTMEYATAFIGVLDSCPLARFLTFSGQDPPTSTVARNFYASLATHCSHVSLRQLHISMDYGGNLSSDRFPLYRVDGDILNPLFAFANLEVVSLTHPVGFDIDDATASAMARAWPHIRSLLLTSESYAHIPSGVTLEGIYAFARPCPHLRSLGMTFDARVVPNGIPQQEKDTVSQRTLRSLAVAASPMCNPDSVAKFLSEIFPKLKYLHTFYEDFEGFVEVPEGVFESHDLWKHVEDGLYSF
ncbi:hypothetical protein B0H11DRAFT_1365533 [Mycena galericulata]|nr:hypothetical protein B0H11DRAFT_1365533 [Mycena galericulata]